MRIFMNQRNLPEDPIIRELVQHARAAQLSRRALLGGAVGGAVALSLAACAPGEQALVAAEDISATDPTVNWANWPLYLDEDDDGNYPTLEAFTAASGIAANYLVEVDDNNSYFAKVKDQLALGQDIGADTVCLTEWMVSRWIRRGWTQAFNLDNIPNHANVVAELLNPDFDPGRQSSLPWQGGFAGLVYNSDLVSTPVLSVADLWRDELKGRVVVLSEMRDTVGVIMLSQGVDITKFTADEFNAAIAEIEMRVADGYIRNIKGNSYSEDLVSEDALAGIVWSGDITVLNLEAGYEKWKFVLPDSGATFWNDTFIIPIGSPRKTNAEKLINWYYDPAIAAQVAAWVNYVTPVQGAYEEAIKIDPALAENQLIFPNDETLSKVHIFRSLSDAEENEFQAAFQSIILG
jgi:spermidine/putrescine transport system substrate-binding protein